MSISNKIHPELMINNPIAHPNGRIDWVDAAKGVGILLVVIGHTIVGLRSAGIIDAKSILVYVHYLIYTFHMPLFFFLAGIFISKRLEKGPSRFAINSTLKLGKAYFIWFPIQMIILGLASEFANGSVDNSWRGYISIIWEPRANFWFVYALALMNILSAATIPKLGIAALTAACFLIYSIAQWASLPAALFGLFWFAPYYAFGVIFGAHPNNIRINRFWLTVLAGFCTFAWFYMAKILEDDHVISGTAATLSTAIAGSIATLLWVGLFSKPLLRFSSYLGRESFTIYLIHIIFAAGMRIVLHNFLKINSEYFILAMAVLAGVCGPLLVKHLATRLGIAGKIGLE